MFVWKLIIVQFCQEFIRYFFSFRLFAYRFSHFNAHRIRRTWKTKLLLIRHFFVSLLCLPLLLLSSFFSVRVCCSFNNFWFWYKVTNCICVLCWLSRVLHVYTIFVSFYFTPYYWKWEWHQKRRVKERKEIFFSLVLFEYTEYDSKINEPLLTLLLDMCVVWALFFFLSLHIFCKSYSLFSLLTFGRCCCSSATFLPLLFFFFFDSLPSFIFSLCASFFVMRCMCVFMMVCDIISLLRRTKEK